MDIFYDTTYVYFFILDLTGGSLDPKNPALFSLKNILPEVSKSLRYIDIFIWEKTINIAVESSVNSKKYLLKFKENVEL
jgi:hypothetical protein